MAKINHFALTPARPPSDQVERTNAEDEVEAGSDDERAAGLINASLHSSKRPQPQEQQSNGILRSISIPLKYFGFMRQSTAQDVEDFFYPSKDSTNDGGQDAMTADEAEEVRTGALLAREGTTVLEESPRPSNQSGTTINGGDHAGLEMQERNASGSASFIGRKRKMDIYELDPGYQQHLKDGGETEDAMPNPTKRFRGHKKAKSPIAMRPAQQLNTIQRETRASVQMRAREPGSRTSPRRTGQAVKNATTASEAALKRRGRPPKARLLVQEAAEKRVDGRVDIEEGMAEVAAATPDNDEEEDVGGSDGITEIILSMSPVKANTSVPTQSNSNERSSQDHIHPAKNTPRGQSRQTAFRSDVQEEEDDDDEAVGDGQGGDAIDDAPPNVIEEDDDNAQDVKLPMTLVDVFPIKDLEDILETVQQVGQKQDQATDEWKIVHREPVAFTAPGKRLMRRIEKLINTYTALSKLRAAGGEDTERSQAEATKLIDRILIEAEVVFNERLCGDDAHGDPEQVLKLTQAMLRDTYFLLIPSLVKVFKLAVEVYQDEEISETESTKQVIDIIKLLERLGERAVKQPKHMQLKNTLYRTSAPTRSIIPKTRKLIKNFETELRRNKLSKKADAWKAGAVERRRRLAAREERELIEKNRKRDRIHAMQRDQFRSQLNDPGIYGFFLRKELGFEPGQEADRQGERSSQGYRSSQRSSGQRSQDDDVHRNIEGDPFLDGDEVEPRMTPLLIKASGSNVLGSKKSNRYPGHRLLSDREREILIHTLRVENKAYRYQLAAQRLGRDMEEIIAFAKVFQESMDKEHENGKWNKEEDVWTYDIWVEKA